MNPGDPISIWEEMDAWDFLRRPSAAQIVDQLLEGRKPDPRLAKAQMFKKDLIHSMEDPAAYLATLQHVLGDEYAVTNEPTEEYVTDMIRLKKPVTYAAQNWSDLDELIEEKGDWILQIASPLYFDADETKRKLDRAYEGKYNSYAEYGEQIATDMERIPEWLLSYINWEKLGRDYAADKEVIDYNDQLIVLDPNR